MHISEGILSPPVLIAGVILTGAGLVKGLREIDDDDMPKTAMMASVFFAASLIHIPAGPASVHLIMNGLAGIILGWAVFPAIFTGLFLQYLMFGYGGITVLGVNTFVMAGPALLCGVVFRKLSHKKRLIGAAVYGGFCAGFCAVITAVLVSAALFVSGSGLAGAALMILAAHLPVILVEGVITASIVTFIIKTRPSLVLPELCSNLAEVAAAQQARIQDSVKSQTEVT